MKNEKGSKWSSMGMLFTGIPIGMLLMMTIIPEQGAKTNTYLISSIICLAAAVLFFAVYVIITFLMPVINRRKAAMMALGREGIQMVRSDATAMQVYKGIYALMDGKFAKAESLLQLALSKSDIRQNQMFCVEWLIRLYSAMENDSKLLWCYRKAVELAPDNSDAQTRLGQEYLANGSLDQAVYCFEQALRYNPNDGFSYYSLATIHMMRGEDDKAFEALQNLKKINEDHPLCHSQLANYYAITGNREMAMLECKRAQLCGFKDPDEINRRINAMLSFNETEFSGEDLPNIYYRKIEKPESKEKNIKSERTDPDKQDPDSTGNGQL